MNDYRPQDHDTIDELIPRAIDTTRPEFDERAFNERFAEQMATLRARAHAKTESPAAPAAPGSADFPTTTATIITLIQTRKRALMAAAAAIIVIVSLLIVAQGPEQPGIEPALPAAVIPAEMTTALALRMAYSRGGLEALEAQCDKAVELLGPRPAKLALQDLYDNGNS